MVLRVSRPVIRIQGRELNVLWHVCHVDPEVKRIAFNFTWYLSIISYHLGNYLLNLIIGYWLRVVPHLPWMMVESLNTKMLPSPMSKLKL